MYKFKNYINTINGDDMKVKDIMTRSLVTCENNSSIHQIAQKMKEFDIGFMIITNNDRIEGVITDRDIVIEMISNYDHKVKDYIHKIVQTINQDKSIDEAMDLMSNKKIKRLLVTDDKKVVGVISIADILNKTDESEKLLKTLKSIYTIEKNIDEHNNEVDEFYL